MTATPTRRRLSVLWLVVPQLPARWTKPRFARSSESFWPGWISPFTCSASRSLRVRVSLFWPISTFSWLSFCLRSPMPFTTSRRRRTPRHRNPPEKDLVLWSRLKRKPSVSTRCYCASFRTSIGRRRSTFVSHFLISRSTRFQHSLKRPRV